MSAFSSYTSREEIEVSQFGWVVSAGIPLLAVFVQVFFSRWIRFIAILDLPLQITIFFAVARRRPVPGLVTGAVIGTLQDALAGSVIGLNGIAKTIIGYLASSLGVKLNVDNPGSRFLMTFGFYLAHQFIYIIINRELVGSGEPLNWGHTLVAAICNGLVCVPLFSLLDKLKQRG